MSSVSSRVSRHQWPPPQGADAPAPGRGEGVSRWRAAGGCCSGMARHPLPYSWNPTGPWSGVGRPTILSSSSLAFRRTGQDEMQGREAVGAMSGRLGLHLLAPSSPVRTCLEHVGDALVFLCIRLARYTNNHRSLNLVTPVSMLFPSILCMHPRKQSREIHDGKKTPKLRPCRVVPHPGTSNNPTHPLSLRVMLGIQPST